MADKRFYDAATEAKARCLRVVDALTKAQTGGLDTEAIANINHAVDRYEAALNDIYRTVDWKRLHEHR